jgi:hypothetical protein
MKKHFIYLGSIEVLIALGAIPAGLGYLADTTGTGMGTSAQLLKNSPFEDFLIPALFLLIVIGFGNAFGAILSFSKKTIAGITGFVLGSILFIWIIFQVSWIGLSSFMQPLFLIIGIIETFLGMKILNKYKNGSHGIA